MTCGKCRIDLTFTMRFCFMLQMRVDYSLSEQIYATAQLKDVKTVKLWLGAEIMLEYELEEAKNLLVRTLTILIPIKIFCIMSSSEKVDPCQVIYVTSPQLLHFHEWRLTISSEYGNARNWCGGLDMSSCSLTVTFSGQMKVKDHMHNYNLLMRTGPRYTHGSCPNCPIILGCWFCDGVQEDNFANSQKSIDKLTKDLELMKDYTTITEVLSNIWPLSCPRLNDSDRIKTPACFRSYGAAL